MTQMTIDWHCAIQKGVNMPKFIHGDLTYRLIGAAMEVHQQLGPGLLESVYQKALAYELQQRHILFVEQQHLPVWYKEIVVGDFIADFVVEQCLIVEIKAIDKLHPNHVAQTLNYLSITRLSIALLLNFGSTSLQYKRLVR